MSEQKIFYISMLNSIYHLFFSFCLKYTYLSLVLACIIIVYTCVKKIQSHIYTVAYCMFSCMDSVVECTCPEYNKRTINPFNFDLKVNYCCIYLRLFIKRRDLYGTQFCKNEKKTRFNDKKQENRNVNK